jgi:hypothetical protein
MSQEVMPVFELNLTDRLENFLADHTKQGKPMKTEGGVKYPAEDYAYVPDKEKPSTWKLRLSEGKPGNITRRQLGRAAAAFSPGGFRGRKVQIPSADKAKVKRKIRGAYSKLGVKREDVPAAIKGTSKEVNTNFMVWKEADGHRWLARYSNNFRDNDNPPEIIAKESHERFVEMVDKGEVEYPELWLWHVPEWRWGKATWVAWDDGQDGTGFALAGGTVDKGCEWLAEMIDKAENVLVSHGMPITQMERSESDPTVITRHITKEISPLLARAAANKITGFEILKEKETDMIPQEKRDALVSEWGLDPDKLAELEALNVTVASEAKEQGLEFKEETETETPEAEVETTEVAAETADEQETETTEVSYATREEVAEALVQTHAPLIEAVQSLAAQVVALGEEVKSLKRTDDEKVAEKASLTPAASVMDWFKLRAVGSTEAKVDGRNKLGKSKPKETEPVKPKVHPIPFINDMILGTPNRND